MRSLLLAALLTGCSATPAQLAASRQAGIDAAAATPGYATEAAIQQAAAQVDPAEQVPSTSELQALAANSPDELVPNAAPEPGLPLGWPNPPAGDLDSRHI